MTRAGQAVLLVSLSLLVAAVAFADLVIGAVLSVLLMALAAEAVWTALAPRRSGLSLRWDDGSPDGKVMLYPGDESVRGATLAKAIGGTASLEPRLSFQKVEPGAFRGSGDRALTVTFATEYAGEYAREDVLARVTGPLGLFSAEVSIRLPQRYLVYPRVIQVAANTAKLLGSTEIGETPVEMPGVGTEFYELRDYHPGDDYRSVNWKATARRGELVVMERMKEVGASFLLVLDARAPGFRETDALASTFLSLANSLGSSRVSFGVLVHDGKRVIESSPPQDSTASLGSALKAAVAVAKLEDSPELLELVPLGLASRFTERSFGAGHPLTLLSELRRSELSSLTRELDPWATAARFVRDTQVRTIVYVSGVFGDLQQLVELAWEARHYRDADFMVANPCDTGAPSPERLKVAKALRAAGVAYHRGDPARLARGILQS